VAGKDSGSDFPEDLHALFQLDSPQGLGMTALALQLW
jgi:hypothetical protein